ncbi:MAG: K+/H+ antiporter [Bdellovibrionales bacterium GWA2_49_15]|nr:MAG: K+/H+ antiporter [Bdellovibrionales bacterium GWA2_49_15]HAZ13204.1 potassium/proton antiporter [Bdellovibrionales bacterium]
MTAFEFQGHTLEIVILGGALLLTLSVLISKFSTKLGVPSLLLFLGLGMLAGADGPGGIEFDDHRLSYAIGCVCLALIIFDGGMRMPWRSIRAVLPVGISLSLFGTFATGILTGTFAYFVLKLSWLEALLLGSIVSPTDASAVFNILRAKSLSLKERVKQTLEFEAGSNDAMAIFMTIGILTLATSHVTGAIAISKLIVLQWGLGITFGWLGGKASHWLINHFGLEYEGLYGVLLFGMVLVIFAATASMGGSGYLAVYIAGLVLGNSDMIHKGSVTRFLDGMAWIAQILIFLTLGLLSYPSHLLMVWKEGLLLAFFLMFIARPLSVLMATPGTILAKKERLFISWVGLRGATPIILAILPWSLGFPKAEYIFNLIFFVVLTSVIIQGISISFIAKRLGITVPFREKLANWFAGDMLPVEFVPIEVEVKYGAPAENHRIIDLRLPPGVLLTSLQRSQRYLIPRGQTTLAAGDKIRGLARQSNLESLQVIFGIAKPLQK